MTDSRPDNPPAFPVPPAIIAKNGDMSFASLGMTLRDYFAAAAIARYSPDYAGKASESYDWIAMSCYAIADAMLAERAK